MERKRNKDTTFLGAPNRERRFRGRKKWAKGTNEADVFGQACNIPQNSVGNNDMRRPYFSKYSSPNFSTDSHTRSCGILGDAPSRCPSMPQFKSCIMNAHMQNFVEHARLGSGTIRSKAPDTDDRNSWHQTSASANKKLHSRGDFYDQSGNRDRKSYRRNTYNRRLPNKAKKCTSTEGMCVNPNNNETSEEGNESPKFENAGEQTSSVLPRGVVDCDAKESITESNRHRGKKDSDASYYRPQDRDAQRRGRMILPQDSEYDPPVKKRAGLLPTPAEAESSSNASSSTTTVSSASSGPLKVSQDELNSNPVVSVSSPSESVSKAMQPVGRRAEKTATVAPLPNVSNRVPPRLSELAEDAESRQLVTPPIEVSYIVDAPPRPPNPGPTYVISSNSNSPAASRPSSRSGRFVGFEQARSATPDVPPRPVNPPPPICAPSPASTPEGMPPRPQNPGPPLDVSLSTMTSRSVPTTTAATFHMVPVSCSSTGGLLPLPAHSKLPSARSHAAPGEEPSPAHGAVARLGILQSAADTLASTTSSPLAGDLPLKSLLPLPDKQSSAKQQVSGSESESENSMPDAAERVGSGQTAVIDLSKPTSVSCKGASQDTQPHITSSCATLSFSTTVVSSSYPASSCHRAPRAKTPQSSKSTFLQCPEEETLKTETSSEESRLPEELPATETSLQERIISCLREKQFADGLLVLKEALREFPEKFGDAEIYEVIEYFGQNDAYEFVVAAARLVENPDERLMQFLSSIVEQVPHVFVDKREDVMHICNDALNENPNDEVIDSCIKCFAALESWDKVWASLRLHQRSSSLSPSTVTLCLQPLACGEDDEHLQAGLVLLSSLPVITKRALDADVVHALWLHCAELGLTEAATAVDLVLKLMPQNAEASARRSSRAQAFLMGHFVAERADALTNFVVSVGASHCQQFLDFFVAGFMVAEEPVAKAVAFLKQLRQHTRQRDAFGASLCVRMMRQLAQRHAWAAAFDLWRLVSELGIACERQAVLEGESQTSIAFLALEVCVRHNRYDTAVSMLSESLVLGQPWTDSQLVRKRVCLLREIFERSIETSIDFASAAFKALLSTKDTDQAILHDYGHIVDIMAIYNDYLVAATHQGSLDPLNAALDLVSIAHNKQLLVKPTVLRYLVVACVRFKLHTKVKEFLQRGMTVSIYPTIDVHSNLLLLPTDLATEEIAALLLLYFMLLKEYLVQAMNAGRAGGEQSNACAVDVLQACDITVVPNNVNMRDREFSERFQLVSTEYGLLQRVQAILASGGLYVATGHPMDYLKSPISAELTFEGGRSVLKLNTSEVYNNVYYIDPPS